MTPARVSCKGTPRCRKQRGQYLVLAIIALIIFVTGLVWGLKKYREYESQHVASLAAQQFRDVIANAQLIYAGSPTLYQQVSGALLAQRGGVPPNQISTGGQIHTPFGSPLTLSATTLTTPNDSINVGYSNVPGASCALFASLIQTYAYRLSIDGTPVKNLQAASNYSAIATNAACSRAPSRGATITAQVTP